MGNAPVGFSEYGSAGSVVISTAALLWSLFKGNRREGVDHGGLHARVGNLETGLKETIRDVAKVKDELAVLPTISAQLSSLDRLVTYRMDDLSRQVVSLSEDVKRSHNN